jgi:hypothetical protein
MNDSTHPDILDLADLASDPEIAALLDFEPVPVRRKVNGWDADAQRAFIVLLATTGSKLRAARAIGRKAAGIDRLLDRPDGAAFKAAYERALALAAKKNGQALAQGIAATRKADPGVQAPGQVLNEYGEWEDEESMLRRAEEAKDSISKKLQRCRRLYLQEICGDPGKRAAFEMLTELPIDWEKAERLEEQPDEPFRKPSPREPDLLLTAENGWIGEFAHGPDKRAELRAAMDAYRAENGLEPIDWDA